MRARNIIPFLFLLFTCVVPLRAEYKYEVSACALFHNEGRFLKEWLEYHLMLGVEHFYLFDNLSTDDSQSILAPYIERGIVEILYYNQKTNGQSDYAVLQCEAYNQALALARGKTKWLAMIELDEFIFPVMETSLPAILKNYEDFGGIYINWVTFGTSNVYKKPKNRLWIETLTHCESAPATMGKSIVRPERVVHFFDPHRIGYLSPYFDVMTSYQPFTSHAECPVVDNRLLIYHYFTGDLDYLVYSKYPKRRRSVAISLKNYILSLEYLNQVENRSMQKFVPTLRKRMGLSS